MIDNKPTEGCRNCKRREGTKCPYVNPIENMSDWCCAYKRAE